MNKRDRTKILIRDLLIQCIIVKSDSTYYRNGVKSNKISDLIKDTDRTIDEQLTDCIKEFAKTKKSKTYKHITILQTLKKLIYV